MLWRNNRRFLFDQDFVDAGCPPDEYDESTELDDLFWTYLTNYWIAGAGVLVAVVLWILLFQWQETLSEEPPNKKRGSFPDEDNNYGDNDEERSNAALPTNLPKRYYLALVAFFLLMAAGYGVAGVGHQIVTEADSLEQELFERATALLVGSASACWFAAALMEYFLVVKQQDRLPPSVRWTWLVLAVLGVGALVGSGMFLLLGIFVLVNIAFVLVLAVWQYQRFFRNWLYWLDVVALLLYAAGIALQAALSGACGDKGYQDCFRDCPLPNPHVFNHNALFHIFVVAFVLLYGLSKCAMLQHVLQAQQATEATTPTVNKQVFG